jgi:hypothetical protein
MNAARARLVSLSLLACTTLALTGCASDAPPTELGPGVVTPGASSTEQPPSPVPVESATTTSPSTTPSGPSNPNTSPTQSATIDGAPAVPAPFRDDDAEIEAENQTGDGRTVRITEIQLSRADGFVAVYTADREQLLGSAAVSRSTDDDRPLTVRLDRPLTADAQLLVELHADNGNGRFDPETDPRVAGNDDDNELEVDRLTYRVR